jgi:hypothetical protein
MSLEVSAVVVNWNGGDRLIKCVSSLRQQSASLLEVIVVDNASTDGSADSIRSLFSDVAVINAGANLGFAGGNAVGIQRARAEYVLLLNNDAWLEPRAVELLMEAHLLEALDVSGPVECGYDERARPSGTGRLTIDPLGHPVWIQGEETAAPFYLSGVCLLFKRSIYFETGGLDTDFFMYFEETDWFWRLQLYGKRFRTVEHVKVHHAGSASTFAPGSRFNYRRFLWRNQNCLQMLLKNYGALSLVFCLPAYLLQNVFEIFTFLLLGKFMIARSYVEGWWFNLTTIRKILRKRAQIQRCRVISDVQVFRRMYVGLGKVRHFMRGAL